MQIASTIKVGGDDTYEMCCYQEHQNIIWGQKFDYCGTSQNFPMLVKVSAFL
jgi:hypothetical protein